MYQYKDFLQLHTNTAILFRYFDTADADSISKMFPASNLLQVPELTSIVVNTNSELAIEIVNKSYR